MASSQTPRKSKLWKVICGSLVLGMVSFIAYYELSLAICHNTLVQSVVAPEGEAKALVFVRDCGAMGGKSTHLSVVPASFTLEKEWGNVLVADDSGGTAPTGYRGEVGVWVKWVGSDEIKVVYDRRIRIYKNLKAFRGVFITYQAK